MHREGYWKASEKMSVTAIFGFVITSKSVLLSFLRPAIIIVNGGIPRIGLKVPQPKQEEFLKQCYNCRREFMEIEDFLANTYRWRVCEGGHLWFNCCCGSTTVVERGKFPWYSPDMHMSKVAKSLFNSLPSIQNLPHIPSSVMELQELLTKKEVSARALADAAKQEPLLASSILQIATDLKRDSEDRRAIKSLEHAIAYMGVNHMADVVLTASITAFPFETEHFTSEEFWLRSFRVARISETLCRKLTPHLIADKAYIAGALANIGKVALAICFPVFADKIIKDSWNPKRLTSWRTSESIHGIPDHTVLGEVAGSLWGLPDYILEAVRFHHTLPKKPVKKHVKSIADVVRLANQLAHWVAMEPHWIEQHVLDSEADSFELDYKDLDTLVEELLVRERQ